ncbi:MAG: nicotinate-nucleotide adenylyltransferase [Litoreibacter sp.]|uniref:nicotinate-nucleotide adenylyltransferase n=1 Tax=Litoreibacter sp. TaxID=1969459 RepID=UPI0032996BC8
MEFTRAGWPVAQAGQTVGLLGGSFDPAHEGHAHITREALKRFGLDFVWWLVSPGNPLKDRGPAPMASRLERARDVMAHPRVKVTDLEVQLGTCYTAQTLAALMARYPSVNFVWLMGADNLASFHHWQDWEWIMRNVPIGVMARPGDRISARRSVAAQRFESARLSGAASQLLGQGGAPRWCYINLPLSDASSSKIRASGAWASQ